MPKISSLYDLIQQTSQQKGRKLKIVCDWDECLQPFQPLAVWKIGKKVGQINTNFEDFFERFWEIAKYGQDSASGLRVKNVEGGTEAEKKAFDEYLKSLELVRKYDKGEKGEGETHWKNYYRSPEWVDAITNAPFLSTAEDLLKGLKENLISELVLISSYRKGRGKGQGVTRKNKVFSETFGKFPECKLELTETDRNQDGKQIPDRWEVLRDKYSDFDLFIDDSPSIIKECIENLPANKTYVLCDYECNRGIIESNNIYMNGIEISSLQSSDFFYQESQSQIVSKGGTEWNPKK